MNDVLFEFAKKIYDISWEIEKILKISKNFGKYGNFLIFLREFVKKEVGEIFFSIIQNYGSFLEIFKKIIPCIIKEPKQWAKMPNTKRKWEEVTQDQNNKMRARYAEYSSSHLFENSDSSSDYGQPQYMSYASMYSPLEYMTTVNSETWLTCKIL